MWLKSEFFRCSVLYQTSQTSCWCLKLNRQIPVGFQAEIVRVLVCSRWSHRWCFCVGGTLGPFITYCICVQVMLHHIMRLKGATHCCSAQRSVWQHCLFVDTTGVGYYMRVYCLFPPSSFFLFIPLLSPSLPPLCPFHGSKSLFSICVLAQESASRQRPAGKCSCSNREQLNGYFAQFACVFK